MTQLLFDLAWFAPSKQNLTRKINIIYNSQPFIKGKPNTFQTQPALYKNAFVFNYMTKMNEKRTFIKDICDRTNKKRQVLVEKKGKKSFVLVFFSIFFFSILWRRKAVENGLS